MHPPPVGQIKILIILIAGLSSITLLACGFVLDGGIRRSATPTPIPTLIPATPAAPTDSRIDEVLRRLDDLAVQLGRLEEKIVATATKLPPATHTPTPSPVATPPQGTVFTYSGKGLSISPPFDINASGTYEVRWETSNTINMTLFSVTEQGEFMERYLSGGDKNPDFKLIDVSSGNGVGQTFTFILKNRYVLRVQADAQVPWTVWIVE